MNFVILKNTVSGQTHEYEAKTAEKLLAHPVFGKVLVKVNKNKPEVLAEPHVIEDGERKPLEKGDADEGPSALEAKEK